MENPLYTISHIFNHICSHADGQNVNTAFKSAMEGIGEEGMDSIDARFYVLHLFDNSIDLVSKTTLKEGQISEMISRVKNWKGNFLLACSSGNVLQFKTVSKADETLPLIDAYGHIVSHVERQSSTTLDRKSLTEETKELLDKVKDSELSEYPKRVLTLKLLAFTRIVQECQYYSDVEIRRRVKSIYADFCSEFDRNDKEHEKLRESMTRWAKNSATPGLAAIGLASNVVGLISYVGS